MTTKEIRTLIDEHYKEIEKLQNELNRTIQEEVEQFRSLYHNLVEEGMNPFELVDVTPIVTPSSPESDSVDPTPSYTEDVEELELKEDDIEVVESVEEPVEESDEESESTSDPVEIIESTVEEDVTEKHSSRKKPKRDRPYDGVYRELLPPSFEMMKYETEPEVFVSKKILPPAYMFFTDEPTNEIIQLGNLKYKDEWKDPQETRIIHPDGVCPCLTTVAVPYIYIDGVA